MLTALKLGTSRTCLLDCSERLTLLEAFLAKQTIPFLPFEIAWSTKNSLRQFQEATFSNSAVLHNKGKGHKILAVQLQSMNKISHPNMEILADTLDFGSPLIKIKDSSLPKCTNGVKIIDFLFSLKQRSGGKASSAQLVVGPNTICGLVYNLIL